jgi:hypothetical protein
MNATSFDSRASELLSLNEARRAYYVDFEGPSGGEPVLFGWLYAEGRDASPDRLVMRHDILDPDLASIAGEVEVSADWEYRQDARSLATSINDLARRANAQDRRIVAWSRHEMTKVVESELDPDLIEMFGESFRDGKATAKRWLRRCRPDEVLTRDESGGAHKLTKYMGLTGYEAPVDYEVGRTALNIRRVRTGMEKRGSWDDLVETQRKAWREVLVHNAVDVQALMYIVKFAAAGLEDQEGQ